MLDAIEDMEYKERESSYKEEHLTFLVTDENTKSAIIEDSEEQSSANNNESTNSIEEETTVNEYDEEPDWQSRPDAPDAVGCIPYLI